MRYFQLLQIGVEMGGVKTGVKRRVGIAQSNGREIGQVKFFWQDIDLFQELGRPLARHMAQHFHTARAGGEQAAQQFQ